MNLPLPSYTTLLNTSRKNMNINTLHQSFYLLDRLFEKMLDLVPLISWFIYVKCVIHGHERLRLGNQLQTVLRSVLILETDSYLIVWNLPPFLSLFRTTELWHGLLVLNNYIDHDLCFPTRDYWINQITYSEVKTTGKFLTPTWKEDSSLSFCGGSITPLSWSYSLLWLCNLIQRNVW